MSSVLDRLRDARPEVPAPSPAARLAARERLLAAIEDEPPELHARRVRRAAAAHPEGEVPIPDGPRRPSHPRPRLVAPPAAGRRSRGARLRGRVVPGLVVAVAALVVAVVLVVPGHRGGAVGDHVGAAGRIEAQGGETLTGAHGVLPAVVVAGLRSEYRSQLREGRTLRTTIDAALERTGMRALRHSVRANQGRGGAFVALDPRTGAVEAIGAAGRNGSAARLDTAIATAPATGSAPGGVFQPVTALAALQARAWTPGERYDDTGKYCVRGLPDCLHNAGGVAYGVLTLPTALKVEDDLFAAQLGMRLNSAAASGGALQRTARQLGFGRLTGIDLPGEVPGAVPDPATARHGRWSSFDNVALAMGRGELAATPIQVAVAYAAIANGGTILTPHLAGGAARSAAGSRHVRLSPMALAAVRQGMRENAGTSGGVTVDVLGSLHAAVAGVAGSSQFLVRGQETIQGWYAGYVHAAGRPLVVVVSVNGGLGDAVAAPVARQLFSQWTTGRPGRWVRGVSIGG